MSLINQMLRDLESRRPPTSPEGADLSMPSNTSPGRRSSLPLIVAGIVVVVIVAVAATVWLGMASEESLDPAPVPVSIATPQPAAPTPKPQPQKKAPVILKVPEAAKPAPTAAQDNTSAAPQRTAAQAVDRSPKLYGVSPSSVVGSYDKRTFTLKGQALDSDGLSVQVSWRDGSKVFSADQLGHPSSGSLTLQLVTGNSADTWQLTLLDSEGNRLGRTAFLVVPDTKLTAPAPKPATNNATVSRDGIEKRFRAPSPAEQAEGLYEKAIALLRKGDRTGAERTLEQALELFPQHEKSLEALASLMATAGRWVELVPMAEKGLEQHPTNLTLSQLLARGYLQQGQRNEAIKTLERPLATASANPEYLTLLAALYQQVGRYQESVALYQRALNSDPQNGIWWAGLAIGYDNTEQPEKARDAYQRAVNRGGLPASLRDYVNRRLKALKS